MLPTRPLFRVDPGWLYVAAGMAICAAGILVPAQQELRELRQQRAAIIEQGHITGLRLTGTADLLDRFDEGDPQLIRRLAATQLNLVPSGVRPVLRSTAPPGTMTEWIDASLRYEPPPAPVQRQSLLMRLTTGPRRLWVFGVGVVCVFFGLLIDPALTQVRHHLLRLSRRKPSDAAIRAVTYETACSAVSARRLSRRADDLDDLDDADALAVACELQVAASGLEPRDLTGVGAFATWDDPDDEAEAGVSLVEESELEEDDVEDAFEEDDGEEYDEADELEEDEEDGEDEEDEYEEESEDDEDDAEEVDDDEEEEDEEECEDEEEEDEEELWDDDESEGEETVDLV